MTYLDLLEKLKTMSESQLSETVKVYDLVFEEYMTVTSVKLSEENQPVINFDREK
jgi:hypothetical protein